jgi:uncharacterized membrane protein
VLVAIAVSTIAVVQSLRELRLAADTDSTQVPSAPFQRLALTSLASALAPALTAVAVFFYAGPSGFEARPGVRVLVQLLGVMPVVAGAAPLAIARRRAAQGRLVLDERDGDILREAPAAQSWTLLILVVAWTLILTEQFWTAGAVPIGWLAVMSWSCVMGFGRWRFRLA